MKKKRNNKKKGNTHGAISVFLVIILVPCITITSLFIDYGRVYLGKGLSYSAADLALNTVLTNYDYDLNDYYGLIASCQTIDDFYQKSAQFYLDMLKSQKVEQDSINTIADYYAYLTNDDTIYDLLNMECEASPEIAAVEGADLANPVLLKKQVVEFMKYRAPIELLEGTGLLNELALISDDLEDVKEDKALTDAKQAYYTSESNMLSLAHSIWMKLQTYQKLDPQPTEERVMQVVSNINSYRKTYEKIHERLVKDLYNTDGLNEFKIKRSAAINKANDEYKSDTYHRKSETDYKLASIDDIEGLMNDLAMKITKFQDEKNALAGKFPEYTSDTYDIQWWAKVKSNGVSLSDFNKYGKQMIKAWMALENAYKFLDQDATTAFANSEVKYNINQSGTQNYSAYNTEDTYQNHYNQLIAQVDGLYRNYLNEVKKDRDSSDKFIKYMTIIEEISNNADNQGKVVPGTNMIGEKSVYTTVDSVRDQIRGDRELLETYSKTLDGIITDLETLKGRINDCTGKLDDWNGVATDSDSKLADMDKAEIGNQESANLTDAQVWEKYKKSLNEEKVNELITRVKNIKAVYDNLIQTIDNIKYGNKKLYDIDTYSAAKTASGISASNIKLTNQELNAYINSSFKFEGDGINITIDASNNPNFEYKPIPELYTWMRDQKWSALSEEQKASAKKEFDEKKDESDKGNKKPEDAAKEAPDMGGSAVNIAKHYKDSANQFPSGFDDGSAYNALTAIETIASTAAKLFKDFEGTIVELRDSLYATEYVFGNFSYATFEKEGMYDIAMQAATAKKEKQIGAYSKEVIQKLSNTSVDDLYKNQTVIHKWNSEDLTFTGNKSLTNKMINKTNNLSYGSEIEYILFGNNENKKNVSSAYGNIYALRYVMNLPAGMMSLYPLATTGTDEEINTLRATIQGVSTSISAASMGIIPEPLVRVVLVLVEIALETKIDMDYIMAGLPVKFLKTKDDSTWGIIDKVVEDKGLFMTYGDYLYLFTILSFKGGKESIIYKRMGDVIQANMRQVMPSSSASYKLSKSKLYFQFTSTLRVDPLLLALPINNGAIDELGQAKDWCTFGYTITRGY